MSSEALQTDLPKEEVRVLTPAPKKGESRVDVWERVMNPPKEEEAITAKEVAGKEEPKTEEAPVQSDRDLVAPKLIEFLKPQGKAEPEPEQTEELTADQLILRKLQALEERQNQELAQKEQEERDAQFVAFRDQLLANVDSEKESLPGFYALGQQDTLVQLVAQEASEGREVSEIEIAREIEAKARETYEKLHAIYSAPSNEEEPAAAKKPEPTISNQLASADVPDPDLAGLSPKERQVAIWEALKNRG